MYIWMSKMLKINIMIIGVTFPKAQSSKLEGLFCHVSVKKRSSNFELWARNSIRKCHPKWDWLYIFGSVVNHQSTIMIFIFTTLLIQTYIQINYYYDENHANSTVITQYVENTLNNKSVLCVVLFFCTGLEWVSVVVLYFSYFQI